ncbi:MAG: DUF3795 domain-containing protein [Candidatus Lokiarchaeota archaeon]|nr:DUF3795 domain-containing protein [Candidatus Lokiarchaeota archaeon]MCK4481315.1 DUF3795 domain-containing protein [Candidatus Lokiarchaeota archaeon]
MTKVYPLKKYPTVACCGLDCGLCPMYYTKGPSRCPGCCGPDFINKHPSCSIITCCVKKRNFETCAECSEYPCSKINKWDKYDSFISHKVSLSNLEIIKEEGIEQFLTQQKRRIELLELILEEFNEGRSKSFFCIATALLPIDDLEKCLGQSKRQIKEEEIDAKDLKAKSKILRDNFTKLANSKSIKLKLKRK